MNNRVIWRFTDGRPGHDAQSRGLSQALGDHVPVSEYTVDVSVRRGAVTGLLKRWRARTGHLPAPDLLIGAGHRSHLPMLAARRRRGGRVIALMKPSLPLSWFDLCVIPEHDAPPSRVNVLTSQGVLNTQKPAARRDDGHGLILIGGPSRHYRRDDDRLLEQLRALLAGHTGIRWDLVTSPRTPRALLPRLEALRGVNCSFYERDSSTAWQHKLASAGQVWVSEDSVSMIYEALTAGARVGLLAVPRSRSSRVSRGVESLVDRGWVTPSYAAGAARDPVTLNEAARCARWIRDQWLDA